MDAPWVLMLSWIVAISHCMFSEDLVDLGTRSLMVIATIMATFFETCIFDCFSLPALTRTCFAESRDGKEHNRFGVFGTF
jgi:hypothetical protein